MSESPSHVRNRRETKAAKAAERREDAEADWAKVEAERRSVDGRTAKLKALRFAQAAETP